jgi:hypothetical protein
MDLTITDVESHKANIHGNVTLNINTAQGWGKLAANLLAAVLDLAKITNPRHRALIEALIMAEDGGPLGKYMKELDQ